MITSRKITDLVPEARRACDIWLAECTAQGLEILITCTLRDDEAQNALYAIGRTVKGKVLTNAKGGESAHNKAEAWDFCIMKHGKCDWDNSDAFKQAGEIAERLGLVWAGRWRGSLREMCHIQIK